MFYNQFMSEELITRTEASKILGVTERTLFTYLERGYLKKVVKQKRIYLVKSELEQLKEAIQNPLQIVDKLLFLKLQLQIKEQQADLDTIKRILNLYYEPLEMPDFSILSMYKTAERLDFETWESNWEEDWAIFVLRLREEDLLQLERITNEEHPWEPFHKLLLVVQGVLEKRNDYKLLDLYAAAREHLRKLIIIWLELKKSPRILELLPAEEVGMWAIRKLRQKYMGKKWTEKS